MWPFRTFRRASGQSDGNRHDLGPRGEKIARRFLRKAGLKILAHNYRCPEGEADLIVLDTSTRRTLGAETIAFVEVKTRSCGRYTDPQSAVDADKRRRLRNVAGYYLAARGGRAFNVRFDIVAIVLGEAGPPRIEHIQDAF